ncbi:hypothetical protein [uncultured Kordia sp.]|uniref:hypothetical protein n=1 Tax=uncultured Kordia sp. TaxID=507699 RepID=UPI002616CF4D|nr:hypothetical protein [uncultured Kordia sp.]
MKDIVIKYTVGLGMPKLLFLIAKATSEYSGAAAITSRLKDFSLRIGMEEGIGVFVLIGILSYELSSYSILTYYQDKIERDRSKLQLKNPDVVLRRIDTYSISSALRRKLKTKYLLYEF